MTTPRHPRVSPDLIVDPGAVVGHPVQRLIDDEALHIDAGGHLRSGTVVYVGSRIGKRFHTGHNVIVREQNLIGDDVQVWSNTVIDYGCRIGNRVKIHSNCYVAQFTTIEDDVFLAPGVAIANDPHPGCVHAKECMRGPTIREGAQIGVNVTIVPFVTIGSRALVGAGSVVTKDVPPDVVVAGNPARVLRSIYDLTCPVEITDRPYRRGDEGDRT